MEPVTLLVTALAAGASAGVAETAATAVRDAYAKLKSLIAQRIVGQSSPELILAEHEKEPEVWRAPLAQMVADSGAASDPAVIRAARHLLQLLDEPGTGSDTRHMDLRGAQGVQIGNHNQQKNNQQNTHTPPQKDA